METQMKSIRSKKYSYSYACRSGNQERTSPELLINILSSISMSEHPLSSLDAPGKKFYSRATLRRPLNKESNDFTCQDNSGKSTGDTSRWEKKLLTQVFC